jgi:small nuclear ribonucleoprotein (snRNP)-like protein
LNVSKLQKLDIDLKDLKDRSIDIDSQVIVTSQNGLVVVGQLQKDDKGNDILFETSKNYMQDGHVTVYYYPTTVA